MVLFFSVNGSGKFQGCAKMTSKIGTDKREDLWKQGSKDNGKWGGTFSVEWISK